ncbi:MAG TPA: spore protease YyaC [Thermoanaerobacterales bacterium]|nr:spore protease YyaC [Thermoanaerobacterales bacterium]
MNVNRPNSLSIFSNSFVAFLDDYYDNSFGEIIVLCIGTDRSTGDSLGPLIGSNLIRFNTPKVHILGNLDKPVHAVNLKENLYNIKGKYNNPFIIAVDACLGRMEHVGQISIKEGPLSPGAGVKKKLPKVGNFSITGVVNIGGFMEHLVLQNTRLSLVMKMADTISRGLHYGIKRYYISQKK